MTGSISSCSAATPTPPTAAATPAATAPAASALDKDVEAAVRAWAAAWSAKDVPGYLAAYGKEFDPPGKQSRKEWEEERRKRIVGKTRISVKLSGVTVAINGGKAVAKFRQEYDADALSVSSRKVLDMAKVGDRWVIVKESTGS